MNDNVSNGGAEERSCKDCRPMSCYRKEKRLPDECVAGSLDEQKIDECLDQYRGEGIDARIARAAAEVEGLYYGKLTRAEEIVAFANRLGAKKIGLAMCVGLAEEARIFSKVLRANGLEPFAVLCKAGAVDKGEIGIEDELKLQPGTHESLCNPVLQARLMNEHGTGLNVIIGLCVGHDSLFTKHSDAPATTLIVKDRVLAHNPAAALYTSGSYYKRLMESGREL
ncbi:Protein of unknown function DUF1847 [Chlorobaculum parvum NCIB 8327]|uniref:DUF1847 domain-containing protein n=1 Tax=Chlorobaculum parvum (strain DSM 263 / NCIMB 8327) TaxID=517417 RepID=B3QMT3_CHLP8|nr:DUF1847 domain-containing protein [Chlorobaculum parvum]ACF11236.1 Protein of unknown function DUF1847 [Chlorobaculum parvum NCIB 8327]